MVPPVRDRRAYDQARYQNHKTRLKEQAAYRTKYRRHKLAASLKSGPCTDCGRRLPPWMMDFDHRDPKTKEAPMARLLARARMTPQLEVELLKCDLLCAVCHAARTQRSHGPFNDRDAALMHLWVESGASHDDF